MPGRGSRQLAEGQSHHLESPFQLQVPLKQRNLNYSFWGWKQIKVCFPKRTVALSCPLGQEIAGGCSRVTAVVRTSVNYVNGISDLPHPHSLQLCKKRSCLVT